MEGSELWRRKSNWSKFLRRLVPAEKFECHPESHAKERSAGTQQECWESFGSFEEVGSPWDQVMGRRPAGRWAQCIRQEKAWGGESWEMEKRYSNRVRMLPNVNAVWSICWCVVKFCFLELSGIFFQLFVIQSWFNPQIWNHGYGGLPLTLWSNILMNLWKWWWEGQKEKVSRVTQR